MVKAVFLSLAALLAATAGGIMLWPLLRAGKRAIWGTLVASMVVATVGLYLWLGTPTALQPRDAEAPQSLEQAVEQLRAVLDEHPERAEGWVLLARSQLELGRMADAAGSFERALQLEPDQPELLVEAAQARARAHPKMLFDDTGLQWLQHARQVAPDNQRATWLVGIVQRQRGQDEAAVRTWEGLLPRLEPNAATALREQIDAARADAGLPPSTPATATPAAAGSADGHAITVRVTLAPALQARVAAGKDTLFVIARAPGGPPMPVAVERHPAQAGPLTVTLDDADSPMPTQKLSALGEVEVFARLSASGNAMRQEGDVESRPVKVSLPTKGTLEIVLGSP
ncbi:MULTISPECIES: tetratricopeptide repeat protein [Stenotrophomonas]|uniref:Cytochrome C biogenesis protein n=1 Tax=Stenotrophomonas nitritireducens TaxID=83617 RepID=A0ABR5NNR4_9GAMM|nr:MULTISPECIES: tetratricopeptide repeat protein [Stenotrophomonas]KQN98240.1 cytochrome C biogenesis protein [Stenotrophomonas sp. Leaf70]KRG60373.1 cytochrome C biogenesis protein [Stenotrophomonas nitritireducens]